jgi:hypothetical protein
MALHSSWPQGGVGGLPAGQFQAPHLVSTLWACRAASACVKTLQAVPRLAYPTAMASRS